MGTAKSSAWTWAIVRSEDGEFRSAFLRALKARGLHGVQHGRSPAIVSVLLGVAWQRCWVHFLRNVLVQVPRGSA